MDEDEEEEEEEQRRGRERVTARNVRKRKTMKCKIKWGEECEINKGNDVSGK